MAEHLVRPRLGDTVVVEVPAADNESALVEEYRSARNFWRELAHERSHERDASEAKVTELREQLDASEAKVTELREQLDAVTHQRDILANTLDRKQAVQSATLTPRPDGSWYYDAFRNSFGFRLHDTETLDAVEKERDKWRDYWTDRALKAESKVGLALSALAPKFLDGIRTVEKVRKILRGDK